MDPSAGAGILVSAGILGFTHGIEPDHVAGITALTHEAANPKLSALVGGCFAFGHALLVLVWITGAYVILGVTTFPPVLEQVGLLIVGIMLAVLSLYLGATGTRRLLHTHHHEHEDSSHSHLHLHLSISPRRHSNAHDSKGHPHGIFGYLKIGTVGALFTLSPPVSMIAFISVVLSNRGPSLVWLTVAAYTVSIVVTMAAVGGSAGSFFHFTHRKGERYHAIFQVVAAVLVLAFAIHLLLGVV